MLYDKLSFKVSPIFFDTLPEKEQLDLINKYTAAAQQGIKELNEDGSRNTIVHDVIRLHSPSLFRVVFNQGSPFLNTYNAEGSTPFLEVVMADDESLIVEMLKGDISESINHPNHKGITPLFAAVNNANPKLVELLLKSGAIASVNRLDCRNMSPLHIAATLSDPFFVEILLNYGAKDSINRKDIKGLSPFQRALITGRASAARLMLEVEPSLVKTINQYDPDSFPVTPLQRASRSGNVELMGLLVQLVGEKIKLNHQAFFTAEVLEDCLVRHAEDFLETILVENVAFPLTIAQNYCNVMVRLKDGKILKIPNADAEQVRIFLLEKKFGPGVHKEELNRLTMYMNPGHGFLRLECRNCDHDKPYSTSRGFYPTDKRLSEKKPIDESTTEEVLSFMPKVGQLLPTPDEVLMIGLITLQLFSKNLNAILPSSALLTKFVYYIGSQFLSKINHEMTTIFNLKLREFVGLYSGLASSIVGHNYVSLWVDDFVGVTVNEDNYEINSDTTNALKITFYVTDEQAKATLERLKQINSSCHEDPKASCRYQAMEQNCIDFMQDVFVTAGGGGNFLNYFTDHQLSLGSVTYLAHIYGFLRSRNVSYLGYRFSPVINRISNFAAPFFGWKKDYFAIPSPLIDLDNQQNTTSKETTSPAPLFLQTSIHEVHVSKLTLPREVFDGSPADAPHFAPVNQAYLGDSLLLGFVLGKAAINTYQFVSGLWGKMLGKRVTADEFSVWYRQQKNSLNTLIQELDCFGEFLDEGMRLNDDEIDQTKNDDNLYSLEEKFLLDRLREEKRDLVKLRNEHIDLLFDAVKLKDELVSVKRMGLPTETHLQELQNKMVVLVDQVRVLLSNYES